MGPAHARLARLPLWLLACAGIFAAVGALAGGFSDPFHTALAATLCALVLVGVLTLDPEVTRERFRQRAGGADPRRLLAIRLLFGVQTLVGLLDAGRFHGSPAPPAALRAAGLLAFTLGALVILWAVRVNRFFVPAVRVQTERGHVPVTAGPYRFVRHPGYLGMVFLGPSVALAMGSWWALGLGLVCSALFVARARFEDRFLMERLPGYADYARRTPYRLLPGLW